MLASPVLRSTSYRNAVLNSIGLVGYWRFGEASGTVAKDELGTNNGTYTGSPTLASAGLLNGSPDTAASFATASSQYVSIGDPAATRFLLLSPFSVVAWINLTDSGAADQTILGRHSTSSNGWRLYVQTAGVLLGVRGTTSLQSPVAFGLSTMRFVAATYDGATFCIYVNGLLDNTVASSASVGDPGGNTNIGRRSGTANSYCNGTIDEPAMWNRALAGAEISRLYSLGRGF